ncbi:MAG: HNH endonuclease [Sphingobacteriales bacterium]|nr:MAG: HNH endonuclease [Sphingobacteriales bacterium]
MSADNIGLCPMCPAGTGEHLLIAGKCKYHFKHPETQKAPKAVVLQLRELIKPAINQVSEQKKKDDSKYKKLRKVFLKENGYCMVQKKGCTGTATQVHHKKGRIGKDYLDVTTWLPVCPTCHDHITEHSKEAIEEGYSERRITKINK